MESVYIAELRALEHLECKHYDLDTEAKQVRCCISKYLHKESEDKRYKTKQCLLSRTIKVTCHDSKKLIENL